MKNSFGYEYNKEIKAIREEIIKDKKLTREFEIHFECIKIYEERHKNDLSLRQRQELNLILPSDKTDIRFNQEEIEYLIERLDGVNHPIGMDILGKLIKWSAKEN